jgi:glycosyltransferase involved in cell wall biosynthesis
VDVCRALIARGHDISIIATETSDIEDERLNISANIFSHKHITAEIIRRDFDICIANIGDNYAFHGGIFDIVGIIPTVGIFHDFYLYNLFNGWTWARRGDLPREVVHDREVVETYGAGSLSEAEKARSGDLTLSEIARQLPMTEWVARLCDGAVAHSSFYAQRLAAACPGPQVTASMPVTGRGVPPLGPRGASRVIALTVGVMNPNKCVDQVIEALASTPALTAVRYRLVGPIQPPEAERLTALAANLGYSGLEIHGPVDDAELERHLAETDLICCLRNPVLEGASGSAIEGLLAGRPLIVAGFYSDLPDSLVFKVPADIDRLALVSQLERLVLDEPLRRRAGAQAQTWAEQQFNLEAYALALEQMIADTLAARPVLDLARGIGTELKALGLKADDPAVTRISAALAEIFPTR